MKILYLTYDGLTDPLGGSQILPYLVGLSKKGYIIQVISFEKETALLSGKSNIKQIMDQSGISWTYFTYTKSPPILSTLFDLYRLRKLVRSMAKTDKRYIIHCRSYLTALIGLEMKRKYGVKFLFDMRGFWADERAEGGLWKLENPVYNFIYRYFKKKERHFLLEADHTVSLTENALNIIRSYPGLSGIPATVIPCCVDTDLFSPLSKPETSSSFNLLYLGSLGTWYMLSEMLSFFKVLKQVRPDAVFTFITHEPLQRILSEAKKQNIEPSSIKVKKMQRKDLPGEMGKADLSIFFIRPGFSKKASSATKLGELMSMGIPIIANTGIGDQDEIFHSADVGHLVSHFFVRDYKKAIEKCLNTQFDAKAIRQVAIERFGLDTGVALYDSVYKKLSA